MRLLPSIKVVQCPCCNSLNVIKVNGITYENNYKSLEGFVLKKIFNCRKCNEQLVNDTLKLEDGSKVQISKCPSDHGKIKSPLCCGQDMVCSN